MISMSKLIKRSRGRGVTLVEILIVLAIVGLIAGGIAVFAIPKFQQAQNDEMDRLYFNPAVAQAKADGLHALGQFAYFDAMVTNGSATDPAGFNAVRAAAMKQARTPAQGGDEATYINAFLNARRAAMQTGVAHGEIRDTSRIDTEQQAFLAKGNLNLNAPLSWQTYGDTYHIAD